jgi:hypothetical protein
MTRELTVIALCSVLDLEDAIYDEAKRKAYLDIEGCAGNSQSRVTKLWRACHVMTTRLAQKHTFDLSRTIAHPKV